MLADTVRTVEFRQALRGYDIDQVDEYLEELALELEAGRSVRWQCEHASFDRAVRGYSPEDVDDFLRRLAQANPVFPDTFVPRSSPTTAPGNAGWGVRRGGRGSVPGWSIEPPVNGGKTDIAPPFSTWSPWAQSPSRSTGSPQTLAAPSDRIRDSWWVLLSLTSMTTWVMFLYLRARSRRRWYSLCAALSAVILVTGLVLAGSSDKDTTLTMAGAAILLLQWIVGVGSALLIRAGGLYRPADRDSSAIEPSPLVAPW